MPALAHHRECFGEAPELGTADRGFFSAKNEQEAEAMGVKQVALPGRGKLGQKRAERQKQRWFRRALRWRAGCESTIASLKHGYSMLRAHYKGERGFARYVGWSIITRNLFSIARYKESQKQKQTQGLKEPSPCLPSSSPRRSGAACGAKSSVWPRSRSLERCQKPIAPAAGPAAIARAEAQARAAFADQLPGRERQDHRLLCAQRGSAATREGVAAWQQLQSCLRELAEMNKEDNLRRAREGDTP